MEEQIKKFHKAIKWIVIFIFVVWLASFLHRCNNSEPTPTITIPEVKGKFESVKPKNVLVSSKTEHTEKGFTAVGKTINNNFDVQYIEQLEAENEELSRAYYLQSDSIKKSLYEKAIQLNEFSQTFDNDTIKIDVSGIARGTVETIKANYTIKAKKIKEKQRVFALKTGLEYGNTPQFNKSLIKVNLGFENKKGNSYNISYDSDKRIYLGYTITVFDIKR